MAEEITEGWFTPRSWWRHQMETFSALLAICAGNSPVTGEFPTQRPVTRSVGVFLDLRLNERLRKQWWGWWFETLSYPLWRHCTGQGMPSCSLHMPDMTGKEEISSLIQNYIYTCKRGSVIPPEIFQSPRCPNLHLYQFVWSNLQTGLYPPW